MALYVVSTPIGNLEDITLRALRILKEVDVIACEDTRRTRILLSHYGIHKELISYHAYSGLRREDRVLELLKNGEHVALVTDSGTPGISDPGGKLVARAVEQHVTVQAIPGPSAITAALACAGLPADRFVFLGFLPRKNAKATRLLTRAALVESVIGIYESPFRVAKTVSLIQTIFDSQTHIVIVRELTKKFEEVIRGSVEEVLAAVAQKALPGEIVMLIQGNLKKQLTDSEVNRRAEERFLIKTTE